MSLQPLPAFLNPVTASAPSVPQAAPSVAPPAASPSPAPTYGQDALALSTPATPPAPATVATTATTAVSAASVLADIQALIKSLIQWFEHLFQPAAPAATTTVPSAPAAPVSQAPAPQVPAVPAAPTLPTGATPAPAAASLAAAIAASPAGGPLTLGAGTYAFVNFGSNPLHGTLGEANLNGLDIPASTPGIAGAGEDRTVIQMAPHTSTHAGDVPTADWTTNQLSLLRVTGSPDLHDFTLKGTDQGHYYNGLRLHMTTNAKITNVKVVGIAGYDHKPPGEIFGIDDYRSNNSVYTHVEVDGAGVGASGFGANDSTNLTINQGYFHDNPNGIGATFWQSQNITLNDCVSKNNRNGFNFERCAGTINIVRPVISGIKGSHDISIGNDQADGHYTIVDPVLAPGQKLRILVPATYNGAPNQQKRSDIHVIVNGQDVTSQVVQWV